ncbi:hypothetical protein ACFYT4_19685 [Streptomyces sp. NPDC004609]|uniref:hypothetical protein n=1 Tax=Streptomyces sp. NPDC004609 TaxID=3364704 RepID=UPI003681EBA8
MTSPVQTPIDAVPIGTVAAPGTVTPLGGGRLAVVDDGRLEIHDAGAFLTGTLTPVRTLSLPGRAAATPLEDGAVVCEAGGIRRIGPDGTTRWALPHTPWHGGPRGPRAPGPPAVSADGRLVSVVVPAPAGPGAGGSGSRAPGGRTRPRGARNVLLLLDALTGRIRSGRPVDSSAAAVTQRWHPDGSLLALSCWTARYSWSTWWIEPRHDGLHIRGGTRMREVIGFLPGVSRVLTMRRAEQIAPNDDRDELASHDVAADEPAALYDLTGLTGDRGHARGWEPGGDEFDDAFLLDDRHLLVTGRLRGPGRRGTGRHWLCDAITLRPLGRMRYPAAADRVTPLGDGTWLTRGPRGLHRWALP